MADYITISPQPFNPANYGGNVYSLLSSLIIGTDGSSGAIGAINSQISSYYNLSLFYQNNVNQLTTVLSQVTGGDFMGTGTGTFQFTKIDGTVYLPGENPPWAFSNSSTAIPIFTSGKGGKNTTYQTISNPEAYLSGIVGGPYTYGPPPGLITTIDSGKTSFATVGSVSGAMEYVAYYAAFYDATFLSTDAFGPSVALNFNSEQVDQQITVQQNYLDNQQTFLSSSVSLLETDIELAGEILSSLNSVMQAILGNIS